MPSRVLPFVTTIPAGTLASAPYTQAINLDGWVASRLDLEVPAGPAGLMGFQIYNNGVAYIPYGSGEWIVWDNIKDTYYLDDLPNASGWAVVGYNTGNYPHSVTTRWHVDSAVAAAAAAPTPTVTLITSDVQAPAVVTT